MAPLPKGSLTAEELSLGRAIAGALPTFQASPTPTAVGLTDGRILLVNDAFLRLTGYTGDELLGVSILDLVAPRVLTEILARIDRVTSEATLGHGPPNDTYHHTYVIADKGGDEIVVQVSTTLLRLRNGSPRGFVSRVIAVPSQDRSPTPWIGRLGPTDADTLASALAELPSFDVLVEPTSLTSAAGVLLQVNRAFQAAFGWTNPEVVGLSAVDLLVPDLKAWGERRLEEIASAELLPRPSHARLRHRDGRAIPATATSIPVRAPDGTTRYIVTTVIPA